MNKNIDIIMDSSSDPLVRKQAGLVISHSQKPPVHKPAPAPKTPARKPLASPAKDSHATTRPAVAAKPSPAPVHKPTPVQKSISTQESLPTPPPHSPVQQPEQPTPVSITPRQTDRPAFVEHIEHTEHPQSRPAPTPIYNNRSPFIDNAEHDKRPLGEVTRATMLLGEDPDYNPALDPRRERPSDPVRKVSKRKKLTIPLPLIVLITVILGIASGVGVYFLLSK